MAELYNELKKYGDSDYYPFHMPGHKRNMETAGEILAGAYGIDITEIDGFDNLHQAEGILDRQQQQAARLYGSDMTCFMVNGSTGGILSGVAACTKKGDRLLMARNCHKSVYHAVYLQELKTSYLYPDIITPFGIADAIAPEAVEAALKAQPDIAAVIVTSPTYEGIVADIGQIARITHRYGKPLIVDEAHGAHFGFHQDYPDSSVRLGADIVIHSLHKTLPAMTQTAIIHVNGNMVDREKLQRYLRIFQTSSPSYVLMASMDRCMDFVKRDCHSYLDRLIHYRQRFLEKIATCSYIKVMDAETINTMKTDKYTRQLVAMDFCKLVLYITDGLLSGQQLYDILRDRYHLQMEMAAGNYVLGILTVMDREEGFHRLAEALLAIDREITQQVADKQLFEHKRTDFAGEVRYVGETVMTIAQAYEREWEEINLEDAEGRIGAEFINLYPPGIPIVVPGERLDVHMMKEIAEYRELHLNIQGVRDHCIKVTKAN